MSVPFKFQIANIFDRNKNDRDVHASECPITVANVHLNQNIIKFGAAIIDDIPFKAKRSKSMKVAQFSSLLYMYTDIRAKKQTEILSKVKLAKDNITKLFKTNGRVSLTSLSLGPFTIPSFPQYCVHDVHPSPPLLTSISQSDIPRIRVVTVFDSLSSRQSRSEAITSLVAYSEHVVEGHVEDFVCILRNVAEAPSPSSPALITPESQRIHRFTFLPNELHTVEEEVRNLEVDAGGVHLELNKLTVSSSCGPLPTSDSEAKYDAILAAEFVTFSFESDDIQEWSDEVERGKQAKMDAHFTYVSEALGVPVPRLSAYLSTDSPADFIAVDEDESISDPSPVKTETTESNTSPADSSLVTSVDTEESRLPLSPILRGFRRVRNHKDLMHTELTDDDKLQQIVLRLVLLVVRSESLRLACSRKQDGSIA
ncbi:hypothetical protein J3R82DRAFT_11563 [Butyriboletus roseoflavus]|nr:hypothetical protein J3R82DRAFT_11563 [Butyriboletus roseoflavus]